MSPPITETITRELTVAMTAQGQGALRNLVTHLRAVAACFVDDPKLADCMQRTHSAAALLEQLADGPATAMVIAGASPHATVAPVPSHGAGSPS